MTGIRPPRRLQNQIVIPLVAAAVVVALVATFVGAAIVSTPIEARVRANLDSYSQLAVSRLDQEVSRLREYSKTVAQGRSFQDAVASGDLGQVLPRALSNRVNLHVDYLAVIDRNGKVWCCVGGPRFPRDTIAGSQLFKVGRLEVNSADVVHTTNGPSLSAIAATRDSRGRPNAFVVLGTLMNREFLSSLGHQPEVSLTILDRKGNVVAGPSRPGTQQGSLSGRARLDSLARAVVAGSGERMVRGSFNRRGREYLASYAPLRLEGDVFGVLEVVQPATIVETTKQRSTLVIAGWSALAVLVLIGLYFYIALRVSRPIHELSDSAHSVAFGDFSPKPHIQGIGEVAELIASFEAMTAGLQRQAATNARLFKNLEDAHMGTVKALAAAIDAKDPYTQGHSNEVARYCVALAEQLGLSEDDKAAVETAAYLHDIGKIGVSEKVLLKPGRLNRRETDEIRRHSMISADILAPVSFPWPITQMVRHHHERWDGSGYPAGLEREEIPFLARVLSIADAFHALTSTRPYRARKTNREAIAELESCAGTYFDPNLVPEFVRMIEATEPLGADPDEPSHLPAPDRLDRGEVRTVFLSLASGILDSFARLGGPQVAERLETELNEEFHRKAYPMKLKKGFLTADWDADHSLKEEIEIFRDVLIMECQAVESRVGTGIATRFFVDTMDELGSRLQGLAVSLDLDAALILAEARTKP